MGTGVLTRFGKRKWQPEGNLLVEANDSLRADSGAAQVLLAELSVIVPTFNERENVEPLIALLSKALEGIQWEVVFVDDDSPDGTAAKVREVSRTNPRVRCVQRLGRRGLTTACMEGILATSAPYIAIIDGDLQHDEALLPEMLKALKADNLDVVAGTRYSAVKVADAFTLRRHIASRTATRLAQLVLRAELTDPVSGFFMARREVFEAAMRRLSGIGNKILIDLFASSPKPLRFNELPYTFRTRQHGESKLDTLTAWEYLVLLADKIAGRWIPVRFMLFGAVGLSGVVVHLAVLKAALLSGFVFLDGQIVATGAAMVWNFALNNWLTYRDKRLRGWRLLTGLLSFMLLCSFGAIVNISFARQVFAKTDLWWLAGAGGATAGAILNYSLTSLFTWKRPGA
jgi:dolichol-phosphate mannosyltransferase